MKRKIRSVIFSVSLLTMVACLLLVLCTLYYYFADRLRDELKNEAALAAEGVEKAGESYFDGLEAGGTRVTLVAGDGTVLRDSTADAATMESHAGREEIEEALRSGAGSATRYSKTLSVKTLYYAMRLSDGSVLRVSADTGTLWSVFLGMLSPILIIFFGALLLSAGLASALSRRLVRPINSIDPADPATPEGYQELFPLTEKIRQQNKALAVRLAEISAKREELRIITDNMSEGFAVLDTNRTLLSVNSAAVRILSDCGAKLADDSGVIDVPEVGRAIDEALLGNHCETMYDSGSCCCQIIAGPVLDSENNVSGAVIIILDVTERERREQLRREFTSNVSHELKTPLTSIYGVSDMLAEGMVRDCDVRGFAVNLRSEAGRLIALLDDMLRLSRLDENAVPAEREDVSMLMLCDDVLRRLAPAARDAGVTLSLTGNDFTVHGIRAVLDEMIFNLAENAVKYNRRNGSVTICLTHSESGRTVTVSDTGIGIPPEHIPRIFERFYRVDKSHSRKIGGTGLGLSIVKHAAAYHGAQVTVRSRVGEGTVFTVSLK